MKEKVRWLKYGVLVFCLVMLVALPGTASAWEPIFEIKTTQTLAKGVTFEASQTVTADGLLDIYVLKAPLNDPNINIGPAESTKDYGFKEPVRTLLSQHEAFAGVNGSFFGVAGTHSTSFGAVIKDGNLVSAPSEDAETENAFATFFLSKENNPFITFVTTKIHFYNNGKENFEVSSINKLSDISAPVIITRAALSETTSLDSRIPGLIKVVVKNGKVMFVSAPGASLSVPEDGYILAIPQEYEALAAQVLKEGQTAELVIDPAGVDYSKIQTAIGGGGLILRDGEYIKLGTAASGRHPRTAIGFSQDRKQLILVVVDGRTHSVGATPEEMGSIMKRAGAYNAMHLDGGGSSTMVLKQPGGNYKVANTPSEPERKVINALGIYSSAAPGAAEKIVIDLSQQTAFEHTPVHMEVYGLDAYYNRVPLEPGALDIQTDDPGGGWKDNTYTPGRAGSIHITAQYKGYKAETYLDVMTLGELKCSVKSLRALPGETVNFSLTGIAEEQKTVTALAQYTIIPPALGRVSEGTFYAEGDGTGYMACTMNGISVYVPVTVGDHADLPVESLPQGARYTDPWKADLTGAAGDGAVEISITSGEIAQIPEYAAQTKGPVTILRMGASKGGIMYTNANQWSWFTKDLAAAKSSVIVVELDKSPYEFQQSKEFELLRKTLLQFGKKAIIVAPGAETASTSKDRVRIVTLSGENSLVKIRILGDTVQYQIGQ